MDFQSYLCFPCRLSLFEGDVEGVEGGEMSDFEHGSGYTLVIKQK